MALIKKSSSASIAKNTERSDSADVLRNVEVQRKKARTLAKQQQAAERIAAATGQLSSGINEAASAAEELRRASDQIAAGAEEASGASEESTVALKQVVGAIGRQLQNAELSQTKGDNAYNLIARVSADINDLINNVGQAARRQALSVDMVNELENQAANIGDIVKAVARIADQTNLLALNAAIEAARAGQHGKGFAVVADEVRTLAETSEKSAKQIQELVAQIQREVTIIAEGINTSAKTVEVEVENGRLITEQLEKIRGISVEVVEGIREIATGAQQSVTASQQALIGSEAIAAAAEEQSAAAEETSKTIDEQARALSECEQLAQSLSELAEDLKTSTDVAKSAEEVASSAEELSSAVQEINRSGSQIMEAINQIREGARSQACAFTNLINQIREGARSQASATEESVSALTQIQKGLEIAQERGTKSLDAVRDIQDSLATNKKLVDSLISGIGNSMSSTQDSIKRVTDLELLSRRIDKIVDAIATVSIQTNMLAVNGSIEAARAGEFGKGFVVVATDIRNLAHDSAENADRIKDLVKGVQDQIGVVGKDLAEIVVSAQTEVEKSKLSTNNLQIIETDVSEIEKGAAEILAVADEIAAAINQVKTGVDQISAAAQEAEKAATEAAAAATQQSQGAEELALAIEEIASLADELQSA